MAQELSSANSLAPVVLQVERPADVARGSEAARAFAASLGFSMEAGEEIAVVATELATNLIRYASRGSLTFSALYQNARAGLRVICQRCVRPKPPAIFATPLAFGVATRARRPYEENGDTFIIKQWEGNALAGVIDGLGHGPLAMRAALGARRYIDRHFDQPLPSLFRGADRACRATRGVVMALAHFDFNSRTLTVAGIGNIEMRLIGGDEPFRPIVRRCIVGLRSPAPVPTAHPWSSNGCILAMHSDGLQAHWDWRDFSQLAGDAPGAIAQGLLRRLGKNDDDATVLAVRSARS